MSDEMSVAIRLADKKFIAEEVFVSEWVGARLLRCVSLSMRSGIVLLSLKKVSVWLFLICVCFPYTCLFMICWAVFFLCGFDNWLFLLFSSVTCILCECVLYCMLKPFFSYPFLRFSYKLLQNEFHCWILPLFTSSH